MNKYITFFLILLSHVSFGQDTVEKILAGYKSTVTGKEMYQSKITYKIYKGHESTLVKDVKVGTVYKNGGNVCTKFDDVLLLNTPSHHLKVNHTEKAILLADGISQGQDLHIDLEELSKYVEVSLVKSTASSWLLRFRPASAITQLPFKELLVVLEKGSYHVLHQTFYYYNQLNFSQDYRKQDVGNVKLEVAYSNYKPLSSSVSSRIFNLKNYVDTTKEKAVPSVGYEGYDVVDIRQKK